MWWRRAVRAGARGCPVPRHSWRRVPGVGVLGVRRRGNHGHCDHRHSHGSRRRSHHGPGQTVRPCRVTAAPDVTADPAAARAPGAARHDVRSGHEVGGHARASAGRRGRGRPAGTASLAQSPGDAGPAFAAAVAAFKAGRTRWPRSGTTSPSRTGRRRSGSRRTRSRSPPPPTGTARRRAPGRLVLLHDPAGQEGWTGTFRWWPRCTPTWKRRWPPTRCSARSAGPGSPTRSTCTRPATPPPSGTVTRVITEGYGTKSDEPPTTGVRAARLVVPGRRRDRDELCGAVVAWCDLLAAAAGLPAQPPGTLALGHGGEAAGGTGGGSRRRRVTADEARRAERRASRRRQDRRGQSR